MLTSANLAGLPTALYDIAGGLGLVRAGQGGNALNPTAPIAQEVATFITGKAAYGEEATGKLLESHFGAPPYGWDLDLLILVIAALFRAGTIDVTSQNRTYRNWTVPAAHAVFSALPRFRAAAFGRQEGPTIQDMVGALQGLRALYGEAPPLETAAIAQALRIRLRAQIPDLVGLTERLRAHRLPGWHGIDELRQTLTNTIESSDDDAVKTFAKGHDDLRARLAEAQALAAATTDANLATLAAGREAINTLWPLRRGRADVPAALDGAAERLCESARSRHDDAFGKALRDIETRDDFVRLPPAAQARVAVPLRERTAGNYDGATPDLSRLESDLRLLPSLQGDTVLAIEQLRSPEARVERVRVSRFFSGAITSHQDLETRLGELHAHCAKLLAEGARVVIE